MIHQLEKLLAIFYTIKDWIKVGGVLIATITISDCCLQNNLMQSMNCYMVTHTVQNFKRYPEASEKSMR